jgi:hypothetical protein
VGAERHRDAGQSIDLVEQLPNREAQPGCVGSRRGRDQAVEGVSADERFELGMVA